MLNREAEAEVERLAIEHWRSTGRAFGPSLFDLVRAAMTWAYRDAARVCRDYGLGSDEEIDHAESCAKAIESLLEQLDAKV